MHALNNRGCERPRGGAHARAELGKLQRARTAASGCRGGRQQQERGKETASHGIMAASARASARGAGKAIEGGACICLRRRQERGKETASHGTMAASARTERGARARRGERAGRPSRAPPRRVRAHEESGCCRFRLRRKEGGAGGGQRGMAPGTERNPSRRLWLAAEPESPPPSARGGGGGGKGKDFSGRAQDRGLGNRMVGTRRRQANSN